MTGPTHRRYDRDFNYLGLVDRDGNRVEEPDAEESAPLECPECGCRHFVKQGKWQVCRHCRRRLIAHRAAQEPERT